MEKESKEWGYRSYKDSLTTVDKSGKRIWVYAKKFSGAWQNRRRIFGYILFLFLVAAPFMKIGARTASITSSKVAQGSGSIAGRAMVQASWP